MPDKKRVFLGINHISATDSEARCFLDLGFEVFVPKKNGERLRPGMLSTTITYQYDISLSIPSDDLELINNFNFYDDAPTEEIIKIVNKYFCIMVITFVSVGFFYWIQAFKGKCILRAYGHLEQVNYEEALIKIPKILFSNTFIEFSYLGLKCVSKVIRRSPLPNTHWFSRAIFICWLNRKRVFLGAAYESIILNEPSFFKKHSLFLPLGIPSKVWKHSNTWKGVVPKIMFVCSNIEYSYYANVFHSFIENIGDMPHTVFGRQSSDTSAYPNIVGFVPQEEMEQAMKTYACMFYHSQEPCHLHYHPLEAIIFGMPLVFMKGGILESLGGPDQPGMAHSPKEARQKLQRILDGDQEFINHILEKQPKIIEKLKHEHILEEWKYQLSGVNHEVSDC